MKNYQQLIIWQRGIEIVKKIYLLTKQFPKEEKFGIVSQITRAAVSIPANIVHRYLMELGGKFNPYNLPKGKFSRYK